MADASRTFSRYVAIGDSSTEGLDDPDGRGGYRGGPPGFLKAIDDRTLNLYSLRPQPLWRLALRALHIRRGRHHLHERHRADHLPTLRTLSSCGRSGAL